MPIDEQETRRNTVVTEKPAARHEVTQTRREYTAEPRGTSNAAVAVLVILAIAVLGLLGLLFWNMQANPNNDNLAAQQPTPQMSQQSPVIVQQPAAPAAQPPIIVNPPAAAPVSGAPSGADALTGPDDGAIQMAVDKKLLNDPTFSKLGITATVSGGKVLLVGTVKAETLKNQIERAVKSIKGVKSVDNQISVISG
jgi:Predicted periplasmic or secreted lipoprotein